MCMDIHDLLNCTFGVPWADPRKALVRFILSLSYSNDLADVLLAKHRSSRSYRSLGRNGSSIFGVAGNRGKVKSEIL